VMHDDPPLDAACVSEGGKKASRTRPALLYVCEPEQPAAAMLKWTHALYCESRVEQASGCAL
jgi:hypothetical protein